ncbi:MAG TPA: hypothetical protein VFW33_08950, partial [Gemmataceae bacterium]|nr:hypothetical protein [Gemmataceae bacterium]
MRYTTQTSGRGPRRGIALIAVLVVVAILALAAYRFKDLMEAEQQAADSYTRQVQARTSADAGVQYAMANLAAWNSQTNYYDNPSLWGGILVQDGDNDRQRARFSIVAPVGPDAASSGGVNTSFLYGVTDEGGKININALMKLDSSGTILYNVLMQLPNMTDAIANSIIFWVDTKATQRSSGATDEYYMSLDPPYHAKNGPLDSVEELLFVQGVTPQLLFGNDRNRNGILDADEDDGSGVLDMGWSAYLTSYSRETNVDSAGNPRIYINNPNLQNLQTYLTNAGFDDSVISFILAARQYGLTTTTGGSGGTSGGGTSGGGTSGAGASGGKSGATTVSQTISATGVASTTVVSDTGAATVTKSAANGGLSRSTLGSVATASGSQNISSLYALINGQVTVPGSGGQPSTVYTSPLS